MQRNTCVRLRHSRAQVCAIAWEAPAWRGMLGLVLFAAAVLAARSAAGRTSCPLTSMVVPFEASTNTRYEITLTDGGTGDLDGAANGECEAAVRLCRGETPLCDDAVIDNVP